MSYNVVPKILNKEINVPTSKSYANRLLILAAISKEEVQISDLPCSTDVLTMIECLKTIGLNISKEKDTIIIHNSFPECEKQTPDKPIIIECGDGGTTTRFFAALCSLGQKEYILEPQGHMRNRPMESLINTLQDLSVSVSQNENAWLSIRGPIQNKNNLKEVTIDCSKSTQFASALLMVLSDTNIVLKTKNLEASKLYFDITKKCIKNFSKYNTVPLDFSSLSYPLALGAIHSKFTIKNFTEIDELQPDSQFLDILKRIGYQVDLSTGQLTLSPANAMDDDLAPLEINCSDHPDLVPTLVFFCSYINRVSILENIEILRHKESDRVEECLKLLNAFSITHKYDKELSRLTIHGRSIKSVDHPVKYVPPKDHRIIMVAYLYMFYNMGGELENTENIGKSYPQFLEHFS